MICPYCGSQMKGNTCVNCGYCCGDMKPEEPKEPRVPKEPQQTLMMRQYGLQIMRQYGFPRSEPKPASTSAVIRAIILFTLVIFGSLAILSWGHSASSHTNSKTASKSDSFSISAPSSNSTNNSTLTNNSTSTKKSDTTAPASNKKSQYKIGTDIPAGEYVLIADSSFPAYFALTCDSSGSFSSIITNDNFNTRSIVTVSDGQYLQLERCDLYPFDEAPAVEAIDGAYPEGTYKVGADIPAGEYKVIPSSHNMAYVEVSSDSTHHSILSNDCPKGEKYQTVQNGQYIKISRADLVLISQADNP